MKQETLNEFGDWLRQCRLRENTLKGYISFMNRFREDISLDNDELMLIGLLNDYVIKNGKKAVFPIRKFVKFLYEKEVALILDFKKKERLRMKKNTILANIEIPESMRRQECMTLDDIEEMYIPPDIVYKLICNAKNIEIKALIVLLYDTGCRVREILDNSISNFRTDGIEVPRDLSKSNKSRFIQYLMAGTNKVFEQYLNTAFPSGKIPLQPFKISYGQLYFELKKMGRDLNFRVSKMSLGNYSKISPHWFRHTRATHLAKTWELGKLQRRLGHSNPQITNIYIEYIGTREAESLEEYMKRTKKRGFWLLCQKEER
jgi:integrase